MIEGTVSLKCSRCNHCEVCQWVDLKMNGCDWFEEEQKTGYWIFQKITQGKRMWCSNCNSGFDLCCNQIKRYDEATKKDYLWTYCPWCGARMEG